MTSTPPERTRFAEPGASPDAPPVAPNPVAPDPVAPDPVAPDPVAPEPAGTAPVAPVPTTEAPAPASTEPVLAEPVAAEPVAAQPVAAEPLPALPEAAEQESAAPVEAALPAVPAAGRAWLVPVLAGLAAVLAVLAAVLTVLVVRSAGPGPVATARSEALAAARAHTRVLFSYDYRHLAKDFAAGKAVTTGSFTQEYARTTGKLVTDVAPRYKAVVVADVSDAAVVSAGEKSAVVLLFVNLQSSSSLQPTPKITQNRVEMTLVKRGGGWLVSKVRAR